MLKTIENPFSIYLQPCFSVKISPVLCSRNGRLPETFSSRCLRSAAAPSLGRFRMIALRKNGR